LASFTPAASTSADGFAAFDEGELNHGFCLFGRPAFDMPPRTGFGAFDAFGSSDAFASAGSVGDGGGEGASGGGGGFADFGEFPSATDDK
jgi:hypothetical protein